MSCLIGNDLKGLVPANFHLDAGNFFALLRITGLVEGNRSGWGWPRHGRKGDARNPGAHVFQHGSA
jgi:hypothetical protein